MDVFQQLKKTAVVLCVLLFAPITVYGYASTIDVLNANWKSKTLTVCIVNNAEEQYEDLFIDAVNTWSRSWPYLNYNFGDPDIDNCNIKAFIVVAYADLTSKGHAGETHTTYQIGGGIIKSDILIPTEQERKDGSTVRVTSKSFHRVAQHEFGHSIGLRHALDENYVEPVDIMAPILAPDDKVMLISSNDIDVLNNLYNVVTEFIPPEEPVIEPLPSPTPLPQVLQKMRINIERAVYYNNETLKFTVVPPATVSGIEANIILYPPGSRDGTVLHEAPDRNGIINVEVPLQDKALGIWNVKVSYVSWVSESAFALKDAGSVTEIESVGDEFSIKVDKSQYSLGEAVAVYGTAPKQSGWWLEVLDSNGRLFTQIDISSMKLKSDGTYEAIFTLVGDPVKSLGIWKIRIMEDSDPTVEKKSVTLDVVAPITEDFLTYENVTHGIKIKYPVDWENEEVGEVAGTLIVRFWSPLEGSDKYPENVTVATQELPSEMKLDDYTEDFIANVKMIVPDFEMVESTRTTLAGNPAQKIVYTGKSLAGWMKGEFVEVEDFKGLAVVMTKDKRGFAILYGAEDAEYSDYLPTVEDMIDSFEIDTSVKPELPQIIEEEKRGISIAMKHKKKVSLVSVRNNSDEEVFGVQLKIDDGNIRFVKARGWDRDRIDQSTVIVQTDDRPIKPGQSLIILLIVDNKTSTFEWTVLDTAGTIMAEGDVKPRA